jgi:uncharacterized protein (DUF427 family)
MGTMLACMHRPRRIEPGPGQESVWDYPRPPRLDPTDALVVVRHAGHVIAETRAAIRVLETSQAPAFYLPPADVDLDVLVPAAQRTFCEWKGEAHYWDLSVPGANAVASVAWSYPAPQAAYAAITDHLAFYPQRVDACFVDGEQVQPNEGGFYGGWVTSRVVGPFKGGYGTQGW